ncbi:MAG: hydroxyacid dehydrogenase [Chloroflexi bacterium]|nr:hydroxyacid dehydrogenase [Chloroflexota bacterium]
MRVWVLGNVHEACLDRLRPHLELVDGRGSSRAELLAGVGQYEVILLRIEHRIDREVFERGTRLRIVSLASAGADHVDHTAARQHGVVVLNSPGANAQSVAELTIAQMVNLARRTILAHRDVRSGIYEREIYGGVEIAGRTLGIVGLGQIGSRVARLALAFGMRVIACDPYVRYVYDPTSLAPESPPVPLVSLEEVLDQSDFVSIHTPLTDETYHLINARRLALMRPTAFLLNLARGPIVAEADLYDALRLGRIAGAALDVFETEPCYSSPLFTLDNCLVTPHIAGITEDAQQRIGVTTAERLLAAIRRLEPAPVVAQPTGHPVMPTN